MATNYGTYSSKTMDELVNVYYKPRETFVKTRNTVLEIVKHSERWPGNLSKHAWARRSKLDIGTRMFAIVAEEQQFPTIYMPIDNAAPGTLTELEKSDKSFRHVLQMYGHSDNYAFSHCKEILDGSSYFKDLVERGVLQSSKGPAKAKSIERGSAATVPNTAEVSRTARGKSKSRGPVIIASGVQSGDYSGNNIERYLADETDF